MAIIKEIPGLRVKIVVRARIETKGSREAWRHHIADSIYSSVVQWELVGEHPLLSRY